MKTKHILLELIDLLDSFERTVPEAETMTLESFLAFALSMYSSQEVAPLKDTMGGSDVQIAQTLSLLHRYSRQYTKRALSQSAYLQTEEEYTYLVCLMNGSAMSKTELHTRNGLERTTGSEMLRRLHRHGLIEEEPDTSDKRQILVRITAKGREELAKVFPGLRQAAQVLSLPLDERQRLLLKNVLGLLCSQHGIWLSALRDASLSDFLAIGTMQNP